MRKAIGIVMGVIVVAAVGYFAYTYFSGSQANATNSGAAAQPTDTDDQSFEDVIWASGKVVPARWVYLGFEAGGRQVVDSERGR
ncbi:MAG: hypothetical protein R2844_05235 [Caldilineales bacterium]